MSLILEALRKSEAERRLGRAPDVLASMPVMHASPRAARRRSGTVAGTVLVLGVFLAMAGWWALRTPPASMRPPMAPSSPRAATTIAASGVASTVQAVRTSATTASLPAAGTPAPTTMAPPEQPATADLRENAPRDIALEQRPVPRASAKAKAEASPIALATHAKQAAALHASAESPSTPVPTGSATATAASDEPELLPITDLGATERAGLPPLKVTMHVYDVDPTRRFMIVDGQRMGEGTRLADGIVLVRVRRDGAELDVRGRHVLLPNP